MKEQTKYTLVGVNGNAFAIMSYVIEALKETGQNNKIEEYKNQAMNGNYDNLLTVSDEYLDMCNELQNEH